jgi:superfamily II DNA or RNA helicase
VKQKKTIVNVLLRNRVATFVTSGDVIDRLNEILRFRVGGWQYTPAAKYRGWNGYIRMITRFGNVGAGLFVAMKEKMEREADVEFVVKDERQCPEIAWEIHGAIEEQVRGYQRDCFEKMIAASNMGGLILNATGTGKTFIAGIYCKALKGNALFVVDELTLLKQAQAEITKVMGEEVGEIGNSIFDPQRVTVGTIQTIHRHRFDKKFTPWARQLHVIILDEMHLALARRNLETIKAFAPAVVFGLTATLELKKKIVAMKAYELAGPVIFEYPLQQGVKEGFLSKGIAISVRVRNDVTKEKIKGNWYQRRRLAMLRYPQEYSSIIVEGEDRNAIICQLVGEAYSRGKYIIVLVERIKHLLSLSQELTNLIPHEVVYGDKKVYQRQLSTLKFEAGVTRVILTNKVFKKGVNIKRVDVIIDGAGMKSRNDAVQKYGRGVRMCEEKAGLIYFDIADVGNRFEDAGKSRAMALKKIGVPVFKVSSELGAEKIISMAETKLSLL